MKRYKQANEEIHVPDELRVQTVQGTHTRFAPRRAAALVTAAALLCAGLAAGAALSRRDEEPHTVTISDSGPADTGEDNGTSLPTHDTTAGETLNGMLPLQLTAVEYPTQAQYPNAFLTANGEPLDGFDEAWEAWRSDWRERRNQPQGYDAGLDETCTALMRQFLSATDETAGKNRVISPLNLYLALAMLTEVTDTTSRAALLDLLGADNIETLRERVTSIWKANYIDDGQTTTRLASSIWLTDKIPFRRSTIDSLASNHYAYTFQGTMGSDTMNQSFRDWINTMTGGLLTDQVGNLSLDKETVIALATTIYYQAAWSDEFRTANTADGIFHAVSGDETVAFLHETRSNFYYWGEGFGAVKKNFHDGSIWMILPDEGVSTDDLLARGDIFTLTQENADSWADQKYLIVNLALPKFDVSSDLDLRAGLAELGLGELFDAETADFSPVTDNAEGLYLSGATHAARVKIDEEGCEAAAYTIMAVAATGMSPEDKMDFVLDRPFIFVITSSTGATLFAGVVETME